MLEGTDSIRGAYISGRPTLMNAASPFQGWHSLPHHIVALRPTVTVRSVVATAPSSRASLPHAGPPPSQDPNHSHISAASPARLGELDAIECRKVDSPGYRLVRPND